jgi:hypothetical protein
LGQCKIPILLSRDDVRARVTALKTSYLRAYFAEGFCRQCVYLTTSYKHFSGTHVTLFGEYSKETAMARDQLRRCAPTACRRVLKTAHRPWSKSASSFSKATPSGPTVLPARTRTASPFFSSLLCHCKTTYPFTEVGVCEVSSDKGTDSAISAICGRHLD